MMKNIVEKINVVTVSSDQSIIGIGSIEGNIYIVNYKSQKTGITKRLEMTTNLIISENNKLVAQSQGLNADKLNIFFITNNYQLKLFRIFNLPRVTQFPIFNFSITEQLKDTSMIFIEKSKVIREINLSTQKSIFKINSKSPINIALSKKYNVLFVQDLQKYINVMNLSTRIQQQQLKLKGLFNSDMIISNDQSLIISSSETYIEIFNIKQVIDNMEPQIPVIVLQPKKIRDDLKLLYISQNNLRLLTEQDDNIITFWNLFSSEGYKQRIISDNHIFRYPVILRLKKLKALGFDNDKKLKIWDLYD